MFDVRSLKLFASILGRFGFRMNLNAWNHFDSPKIENQADLEVKSVEKTILRVKFCEIMWNFFCSLMNLLTLEFKMFFFLSIISGDLSLYLWWITCNSICLCLLLSMPLLAQRYQCVYLDPRQMSSLIQHTFKNQK